MSRVLMLALLLAAALSGADAYDAWSQGRPQDAVPTLVATAKSTGRWDAWLDAGLAAAAAGDRGVAVSCLAVAHARAPERPEPRDALRALDAALPTTWGDRAGPLALPGSGWPGVAVLALAGVALGLAAAWRRQRGWCILAGTLAIFVALPGLAATWIDGRRTWLGTVRDCAALDSTGTPLRSLPAGTLLERATDGDWSGRILVRLGDGGLAYVATADVTP